MLEIYQELVNIISKGERAVMATIISSHGATPRKAGAKMLIKEDGTFLGTVGGGGTEHKIRQTVGEIMRSGKPQVVSFDLSGKDGTLAMICGGQMEIFLEPVMPPDTLYLFGLLFAANHAEVLGPGADGKVKALFINHVTRGVDDNVAIFIHA